MNTLSQIEKEQENLNQKLQNSFEVLNQTIVKITGDFNEPQIVKPEDLCDGLLNHIGKEQERTNELINLIDESIRRLVGYTYLPREVNEVKA